MYSVPKGNNSMPKYLEIIYDENDDQPNAYEIPLPPLDENEIVHTSSPTPSEKSNSFKCDANNEIKVKSRTVSSSSTVSESSMYKKDALNVQPDDDDLSQTNVILTVALPKNTSNENLLPPPPPPTSIQQQSHDHTKRKLQQMYANSTIENAIRNCDGITSM